MTRGLSCSRKVVHGQSASSSASAAVLDPLARRHGRPRLSRELDRITVDPARLGGKPCIRGLRISVGMIVEMVAAGKTTDDILGEYPYLEAEDIRQALAYSAALAESEYHLELRPTA